MEPNAAIIMSEIILPPTHDIKFVPPLCLAVALFRFFCAFFFFAAAFFFFIFAAAALSINC